MKISEIIDINDNLKYGTERVIECIAQKVLNN